MKIAVLDGYTLNPGDLRWEDLERLGELIVYERTVKENPEIIKAIGNAEIVFTNKTPLSEETLGQVPSVKYIGVLATGYNVVDVVTSEPVEINNPLLKAHNCIVTPHIVWAPKEARMRLMNTAVEILTAFFNGFSENVINI